MSLLEWVDIIRALTVPVLFLIAVLGFFIILFTGRLTRFKIGQIALEADQEASRIRARLESIEGDDKSAKQYVLLQEYHAQGLAQSKISFWFSLFFAALGFVIIIISILVFVFDQRESVTFLDKASTPLFSMVAGTIIDAVAALFFVQSNKARQLMTEFFDKLRTDRKLDESLALVSEMGNNGTATRVKALLCLNFAEIDAKDDLFRQVVGEHRLETQKSTTGVEK